MRTQWLVAGMVLAATPRAFAASAKAAIQGTTPESHVSGTVNLADTADGLHVDVQLRNAPPGKHGLHIHEKGSCADAGNAAGGHFNPSGVHHGFLPKDGLANAHPGDLGNIDIAQNGTGHLELTLPGVHLREGVYAVDGRAIVVHEKVDDFSQPTGNAGSRIGCGVIAVTK